MSIEQRTYNHIIKEGCIEIEILFFMSALSLIGCVLMAVYFQITEGGDKGRFILETTLAVLSIILAPSLVKAIKIRRSLKTLTRVNSFEYRNNLGDLKPDHRKLEYLTRDEFSYLCSTDGLDVNIVPFYSSVPKTHKRSIDYFDEIDELEDWRIRTYGIGAGGKVKIIGS